MGNRIALCDNISLEGRKWNSNKLIQVINDKKKGE